MTDADDPNDGANSSPVAAVHDAVRPGDSLSVAVVVAHKRPSESTPSADTSMST